MKHDKTKNYFWYGISLLLFQIFTFFRHFFFFLTDVAYRKENSFKKHSDTKNLHEKCSTYYNE